MYSQLYTKIKILVIGLLFISISCCAQVVPDVQYIPQNGVNFGGLNTKYDETLIGDNEASDLQNILINIDGSIEKRPGCQLISTISSSPVELYTYKKNNGTIYLIASTDTRVLYSQDGINFTLILDGLTSGKEMCFVTVSDTSGNDSLVFDNGVDYRHCWDGTVLETFTSAEQVKFEKATWFQGRLWGMDSGTYATRLYYSPLNNPDSFTNYNYLIVSFPVGEKCTGLQPLTRLADDITSYLLIFSSTSTWGLKNVASSISAGSLSPIFSEMGSLSHYANVNIEGVQNIPTKNGIIGFDGTNLTLLSDKVEPTYSDFGQVIGEKHFWTTSSTVEFIEGNTFTNIDTTSDGQISYGGSFGFSDGWNISVESPISYFLYTPIEGTYSLFFQGASDGYFSSCIVSILSETNSILNTQSLFHTTGVYKKETFYNTWTNQNIKLNFKFTFQSKSGYCTSPLFMSSTNTISIYMNGIVPGATKYAILDAFRPESATYVSKVFDTSSSNTKYLNAPTMNYTANGGTVVFYIRSDTDNISWNDTYTPWIRIENGVEPNITVKRYLQWQCQMASDLTATLPILYDVTINWSGSVVSEASLQGIYWDDYYLLSGTTSSSAKNNFILARNVQNNQYTQFSGWNVRRWTEFRDDLWFGSSLNDGGIYKAWVGYNDNGDSIVSYYKTKTTDFGANYDNKQMKNLYTTIGANRDTSNIEVYWTIDDVVSTIYDTIPLYSAVRNKIMKRIEHPFSFYFMNVEFYHDTIDQNFKIFKYQYAIKSNYKLKDIW